MKKGQISVFLIISIVILLVAGYIGYTTLKKNKIPISRTPGTESFFAITKDGLRNYITDCIYDSIVSANEKFGVKDDAKEAYEAYVETKIPSCLQPGIDELKRQNFGVEETPFSVNVNLNEDTIEVHLNYAIKVISDKVNFEIDDVNFTFDKVKNARIEGKDLIIDSSDGRVRLVIPAGVTMLNGASLAGIKVLDKHFDGQNNGVVIGKLAYEALPDGARFSAPIEISINFNGMDVPWGVTTDSLSIAYWDKDLNIWKSLDTDLVNGRLTAKTDHFTKFAVVYGCGKSDVNRVIIPTNYLFQQKYSYTPKKIPPTISTKEEAEAFLEEMALMQKKLCENDGGNYWSLPKSMEPGDRPDDLEGDTTIIPTLDELNRIVTKADERIDETPQHVNEKFLWGTYGGAVDESCISKAKVTPYCCCTKLENGTLENCDPFVSYQECQIKKLSNNKYEFIRPNHGGNFLEQCIPAGKNLADYDILMEKGIIGYNKKECIGGTTMDADGDGKILEINFLGDGDSCIKEGEPQFAIETEYSDGVNEPVSSISVDVGGSGSVTSACSVKYNTVLQPGKKNNAQIVITEAESKYADTFCSRCRIIITIVGTGIYANGYTQCEKGGEDELSYYNNNPSCKKCVPLEGHPDTFIADGETTGDCKCTRNQVGTAWCNTMTMCDLEGDTPSIVSWTPEHDECELCNNPLEKSTNPYCQITRYLFEVEQ